MSYDHAFVGEVHNRRFIPDDWPRYSRALDRLEGKRARLVLGPQPVHRSDSQIAYYWAAIIRTIALETGGDQYDRELEDDVHHELLQQVLVPMLPERFLRASKKGRAIHARPSTSQLSQEEMTHYIGRCKDYAFREWGIIVPDIDQVSIRRPGERP